MPLFESCFSELRVDGRRLYLKGVNWFGFETTDMTLHGLWCKPFAALLDFVAENGFNALRIPVSGELIEGFDSIKPTNIDFSQNPELKGTTAGQQLDFCIREAAKRGILVLLDLHHQAAARGITELWYDDEAGWGEERVIACLKTLCERYKCKASSSGRGGENGGGRSGEFWNVFAVDLNNEPHGRAAWGTGCPRTDWRLGAERLGTAVLSVDPSLLVFCEGTSGNARPTQCPEPCFWGGGLCSAVEAPVRLPVKRRLVLSPHVYGPLVFMQSYFSDPTFPKNMPAIWEKQWAHSKTKKPANSDGDDAPAIVVGEFGGRFPEGSLERCWAAAFASYLRETGLSDCFFWCVNPNSGDTGGLLKEDWSVPSKSESCLEAFKLQLLAAINPRPTRFDAEGNVVDPGGGPGYDPAATAMPDEVARALAEFSRGGGEEGGGGGGENGGGAAAANGDGANSAPPDSAASPLPAPVTTSHPSGITVTTVPTKSWPSGSVTAFQCDVKIKNESGSSSPPTLTLSCEESIVEQSWNCTRLADTAGKAVFGLPEWCVSNGGIAPGAEVTAGGVFLGALPAFEIGFS